MQTEGLPVALWDAVMDEKKARTWAVGVLKIRLSDMTEEYEKDLNCSCQAQGGKEEADKCYASQPRTSAREMGQKR